jgi:hypothetical protein
MPSALKSPPAKSPRRKSSGSRSTAEEMASRQREISVSEFFAKNRHLLGFDNPRKALLTTVKEAVDNALDACEEAGILPDITVELLQLAETRFKVTIRDNGPGIVRKQIENIFGKLLYGSKFHRMKMSRGQQGIGISAAEGSPVGRRVPRADRDREPARAIHLRHAHQRDAGVPAGGRRTPSRSHRDQAAPEGHRARHAHPDA